MFNRDVPGRFLPRIFRRGIYGSAQVLAGTPDCLQVWQLQKGNKPLRDNFAQVWIHRRAASADRQRSGCWQR